MSRLTRDPCIHGRFLFPTELQPDPASSPLWADLNTPYSLPPSPRSPILQGLAEPDDERHAGSKALCDGFSFRSWPCRTGGRPHAWIAFFSCHLVTSSSGIPRPRISSCSLTTLLGSVRISCQEQEQEKTCIFHCCRMPGVNRWRTQRPRSTPKLLH